MFCPRLSALHLQVSRAHGLVDEACTRLAERLPQDVMAKTSAIAERGGLPPGPEGELDMPLPLVPRPLLQPGHSAQTPSTRWRETRAGVRTKGNAIDAKVIFKDPEAHMRRIREERRLERLSAGGAGQAEASQPAASAGADVEMVTGNGHSQTPAGPSLELNAGLPAAEAIHTYEGTHQVNALVSGRDITGIAAFRAPPARQRPVATSEGKM